MATEDSVMWVENMIEIEQFQEKIIIPLVADITRTLEVTCFNSGKDNHGSNFIGNTSVLIGIETISQFLNKHTASEISEFNKNSTKEYKTLSKLQKEYVLQKHTPYNGSNLAAKFMKGFFNDRFKNDKPVGKIPLYVCIPLNPATYSGDSGHPEC